MGWYRSQLSSTIRATLGHSLRQVEEDPGDPEKKAQNLQGKEKLLEGKLQNI